MAKKPLPTVEQLRQLLRYEPETGALTWRERGPEWFRDGYYSAQGRANNWNAKLAGKRAGHIAPSGYRHLDLFGHPFREHRVIWAMTHGEWPKIIDHIDGDPANNRLNNLRAVSQAENCQNCAMPKDNISGVVGVCRDKWTGRWQAYINIKKKRVALGRYEEFSEAVDARKAAEKDCGYHANHGRR